MKKKAPAMHGLVGTLTLAASLIACEPTPHFPTPEQPVVGLIGEEQSAIVNGADQQIGLLYYQDSGGYRIRVSIPAGAYPVGARVTIRLVRGLGTLDEIGDVMSELTGRFKALQLLPAGLVPALPLRVEMSNDWLITSTLDLLHAHEGDELWTTMIKVTPGVTTVVFEVKQPGLWALADHLLPPQLETRLQRTSLSCDGQVVANPLPVVLDLSQKLYIWTRVTAQGCRIVETGPITAFETSTCYQSFCCGLDAGNDGLTISWSSGMWGCGVGSFAAEHYAPIPAGSPDILPPMPDAGCPTADGGAPDAGRG